MMQTVYFHQRITHFIWVFAELTQWARTMNIVPATPYTIFFHQYIFLHLFLTNYCVLTQFFCISIIFVYIDLMILFWRRKQNNWILFFWPITSHNFFLSIKNDFSHFFWIKFFFCHWNECSVRIQEEIPVCLPLFVFICLFVSFLWYK